MSLATDIRRPYSVNGKYKFILDSIKLSNSSFRAGSQNDISNSNVNNLHHNSRDYNQIYNNNLNSNEYNNNPPVYGYGSKNNFNPMSSSTSLNSNNLNNNIFQSKDMRISTQLSNNNPLSFSQGNFDLILEQFNYIKTNNFNNRYEDNNANPIPNNIDRQNYAYL
jgi:hypothetical protein